MSEELAALDRYFHDVLGIRPTAPADVRPGPPGRKVGRAGEGRAEDEADRAVVAVGRAIGLLVALLGDDDPRVVEKAIRTMAGLGGGAVVGPLAAALPRAESPRHRLAIVAYLGALGGESRAPALRALIEARGREPDPHVAAGIRMALTAQILKDPALAPRAPGAGVGAEGRPG